MNGSISNFLLRPRTGVLLALALLAVFLAGPTQAQDARDRLDADISALLERVETAAAGPAERLADQELDRARNWLIQAEEANKRRIPALARMLFNNAAMDIKVAEAKVEAFALTQERKQLLGQVEALQRAVDDMAAEGVTGEEG